MLPLGPDEERLLVAQLCDGNEAAFEMLYQRFIGRVLGLAIHLLGNQASAEDAAQEAFARVFENIHRFRGEAKLATWINRIATNVCLSELRRRKRRPPESDRDCASLADPVSLSVSIFGKVSDNEMALSLAKLLRQLEPQKMLTFYLYHVEELSAAEVAQVLDDSRAAVLKRLQRTRLELLDLWEEQIEGPQRAAQSGRGDK